MKTLLLILPYAGLILSATATVWGLTHELYTKDENNARRLTKAGKYSIAYTLLGLLVSFNTGVLKTITDSQDKAEAERAAERKERQAELEKLTQQQQEEAREQKRRDDVREQKEQLSELKQNQRGNELAQQQRDLLLAQEQLSGFNKAEHLARQRTLAELKRSNGILFNISRGQYLIGRELELDISLTISFDYPPLKFSMPPIENRVLQSVETAERQLRDISPEQRQSVKLPPGLWLDKDLNVGDRIMIRDNNSPLLPQGNHNDLWQVTEIPLEIGIYAKGHDADSPGPPDLLMDCKVSPFKGVKKGEMTYLGSMEFLRKERAFGIAGAPITAEVLATSNKLVSFLDLPGATLEVKCLPPEAGPALSKCKGISINSFSVLTSSGMYLSIEGSKFVHRMIGGEDFLVHYFDVDTDNFFEKYVMKY